MAKSDYWNPEWGKKPSTTWDSIRGFLTEEEWEAKGRENQAALERNMYELGRIHERMRMDEITEEDLREIVAVYYGMTTKADENLGRITDALRQAGEWTVATVEW